MASKKSNITDYKPVLCLIYSSTRLCFSEEIKVVTTSPKECWEWNVRPSLESKIKFTFLLSVTLNTLQTHTRLVLSFNFKTFRILDLSLFS